MDNTKKLIHNIRSFSDIAAAKKGRVYIQSLAEFLDTPDDGVETYTISGRIDAVTGTGVRMPLLVQYDDFRGNGETVGTWYDVVRKVKTPSKRAGKSVLNRALKTTAKLVELYGRGAPSYLCLTNADLPLQERDLERIAGHALAYKEVEEIIKESKNVQS